MENTILKVKRNEGKNDIRTAFIFSCPGQEELKSGRLVNGQTGKNLDMMLTILNKSYPDIFPSCDRYDYRITNSSEMVHYKAYDNRSEPSAKEITDSANIERLKHDIDGYSYVITFGRSASLAAEQVKKQYGTEGVTFMYSQHLSFLSLNSSIKEDVNGDPIIRGDKNATFKRLEAAAKKITDQLVTDISS